MNNEKRTSHTQLDRPMPARALVTVFVRGRYVAVERKRIGAIYTD